MIPIKVHEIKVFVPEWYNIEKEIKPECNVEVSIDQKFSFSYCVAYRHPSLPEWIVARWYWNDQWIWTPDWLWYDN